MAPWDGALLLGSRRRGSLLTPVDPMPLSPDETSGLPWQSQLTSACLTLGVVGASVGASLWLAHYDELTELIRSNTMVPSDRSALIATTAVVGALAAATGLGYALWHRSRRAVVAVHRVATAATPLSVAFAVPLLLDGYAFRDAELLFSVMAVGFGLCLELSLRRSLAILGWPRGVPTVVELRLACPRLVRWLPPLLVAAMASLLAVYVSAYGVMHHYRLQTRALDMAHFDNLMWNLLHGEWFRLSPGLGGASHIETHASFGAYLLLPLYALRPRADTLIVLQALLCALGVVPIYLLARRRLAMAAVALVLAYGYVLYAPLHGPLFYDFHFLTLAPLFVGWVLYAFESGRRGWLVVAWIAAVALREELSAGLAMASLFYLLCGKRPRWAFGGALVSAAYFVLVKFVVMPAHQVAGSARPSFDWLFDGLVPPGETGFSGVLRTLATNPVWLLKTALTEQRVTYVLQLLGPVLLLPLRSRRSWLLLVVPAAFTLLTSGVDAMVSIRFQYAAHFMPYVFAASAFTLSSWRRLACGRVRIAAAALALVAVSSVFSYQYGAFFHRQTFRGGFTHVEFHVTERDRQRHADLYALIARIPPDASVAATETEAPHVSARRDCQPIRYGHQLADFLLVNVHEARGGESHHQMQEALATGRYGFVERRGDFELWGKGADSSRNAEGAMWIGITSPGRHAPTGPSRTPAPR